MSRQYSTIKGDRVSLPVHTRDFDAQFPVWLAKNGAEVLKPTNPYEVVRYRAMMPGVQRPVINIVYCKDDGRLTWCGGSKGHYHAFLTGSRMFASGGPPDGFVKPDGRPFGKHRFNMHGKMAIGETARKRGALLARDGDKCFYCGEPMDDDVTLEHLLAKAHGGSNVMANLVLAHSECNRKAGHLSLVEKLALRA